MAPKTPLRASLGVSGTVAASADTDARLAMVCNGSSSPAEMQTEEGGERRGGRADASGGAQKGKGWGQCSRAMGMLWAGYRIARLEWAWVTQKQHRVARKKRSETG